MRLSQLVKHEKNNPDLESKLNISEILESVQNIDTDETSLASITREIIDVLRIHAPEPIIPLLCEKLIEYRYIERVYQLKFSRQICWISLGDLDKKNEEYKDADDTEESQEIKEPSIKRLIKYGGVFVKIIFTDLGTNLLIRTRNGFIQVKMNNNLIFQRLSDDEKIVMGCRDLLNHV